MPKKVSKSITQRVSQSVKINLQTPRPRPRPRRLDKQQQTPLLNTGQMLYSHYIPSGINPQIGKTYSEQIPQVFHKIGRMERTIDDLLSNVSNTHFIKADPKPIFNPIDQPVAYDSGFLNPSQSPMNFNDNAIRRMPQIMEKIPIPKQGMFGNDPMMRLVQQEMESDNKSKISNRNDNALVYSNTLRQQQDIQQQMNNDDNRLFPQSPYEQAEFK